MASVASDSRIKSERAPDTKSAYDPATFRPLTYFDAVAHFRAGEDDPRRYLERCLETIAACEPAVKAWVILNERGAREQADASAARWRTGKPLSSIDGMPIGIKDLLETKDMPTQMGCAAFDGNFPKRDSAVVRALRDAGAVLIGKTVTTELGGAHPGPTRNPFDTSRTPGGSSSGSAAAIGAGMIPAAIGTQVGGSVIRPASYCANWALKPTQGALHRGERQGYSQSTVGVHAGSAVDMWRVAIEIGRRAGGDPGHLGLFGPLDAPEAVKPQQLIVMETGGWEELDGATRDAFDRVLAGLRALGVNVLGRGDSPLVESFERAIAGMAAVNSEICAFENRWSFANIAEQYPGKLSARASKVLERGKAMSVEDYRQRLLEREEARQRLAAIAPLGDALISLSSPGTAPVHDENGARPTGDAIFNCPSSTLGAPAVTVPLIAVAGMPVGVQIMGQAHADARVAAVARWVAENVKPVKI
ncbi:MAG TPA: amidase [Burkholderiales bacterium]|nr:amidase [Burkholderiales bacterium]